MPVRCQDCNSHFLLDSTTVAQGLGCPDCGGTKLERDQPSPTHSDGQLKNMVDPATQIDAGGNPLQEGVWANIDGGWQPRYKRDEFFAKVAAGERWLPQSGIEPTVHGTAIPHPDAGLHTGNLYWLNFLDAHINGEPVRENYDKLLSLYGPMNPHNKGPVTISVHHPEHLAAAIEAAENPHLMTDKSTLSLSPTLLATGRAITQGQIPAPPMEAHHLQPTQPRVMSNHYNRALSQDPYLPWYHQADVQRFPGDGGAPTTLTNEEWAAGKKERYQQRQNQQSGHRLDWQPGQRGRGIMIAGQLHTWPVDPTDENPHGGFRHGEYVKHLGVNPQNVDFNTGFEIMPDGSMSGTNIPPQASQIDPFLHEEAKPESWGDVFASTKTSIAPLLAIGGRMLLGRALGGLMRKAIAGQGNFLQQAPQPEQYGARPVGLIASEHTAVGVNAPVETPDSTPDLVEDHDPESVDQQEFNDGDMSPAGNNPNLNGEAGGSQNPAGGEDQTVQKLEFRHDGDGVQHAEMLLPVIMEYINSDKSALDNPQLKALHEQLEKEIPGYLDLADEEDESVHKLLEELRKPDKVHARTAYMGEAQMPAGHNPQADWVQQTRMQIEYYRSIGNEEAARKLEETLAHLNLHAASAKEAMLPGQQQMGMGVQQQMPMPGTHQNPVQQGGMPVSGKCMNCGGVVNADGSCPQCGASPGANQMGNMEQPGGQQTPLGIMPSPYAHTAATVCKNCGSDKIVGPDEEGVLHCASCGAAQSELPEGSAYARTAADHQGPITPQQMKVFAEYLIEQGRNDEVATMMANPAMYADEWAQFLNRSTQPPEVDPAEQAPQPAMDPSQMGQMPVPPMSIPQPTGKTAGPGGPFDMRGDMYRLPSGGQGQYYNCPNCGGQMSDEGECFRCGYSYGRDGDARGNLGLTPAPQGLGPVHQGKTAAPTQMGDTKNPRRCPKCTSATTSLMNSDGDIRCHRCGNQWTLEVVEDHPVVKSNWKIVSYPDALNNDGPNPVAAPAAELTAPGDREQQSDSTLAWQSSDGTPLQVGQVYEMHSSYSPIPDVVKIQQTKPDSIVVTMEGEYNSPTDPQDANGPGYTHEITLQELQENNLTFNPVQTGEGEEEQSQDQGEQDGIGQTVNTEPTRQSPEVPYHANVKDAGLGDIINAAKKFLAGEPCPNCGTIGHHAGGHCPVAAAIANQLVGQNPYHEGNFTRMAPMSEYDQYFGGESGAAAKAKASMIEQYGEKKGEEVFYATVNKKKSSEELPTDHCPNCEYGHVTSSYNSPTEIQYECFRCAHQWKIADEDTSSAMAGESREWLNEDDGPDGFNFDRVVAIESSKSNKGRNIQDIAKRDPRHEQIRERLNKNAGAKFSPREQKEFIDEEGTARNSDRLNLDGTHYVESAFDNSKARPDRVNDNYLGLGL